MAAKTYALNTRTNPLGLYASDDLGLTWAVVDSAGFTFSTLTDIESAPYDSNQILIATSTNIVRSIDGGATFNVTGASGVYKLFYKDVNSIIGVGGSASNPQIITISNDGGGIFTPTGVTAVDLADSAAVDPKISTVFFTNNAAGFIAVSWDDPAGGRLNRIWRTTDGGVTWTNSIDLPLTNETDRVVSIHADLNADKVTILTAQQGIWQVDYALLGVLTQTSSTINGGSIGEFHQVGADPSKVFILTSDGALYYSSDSGITFTQRTASVGADLTSGGGGIYAYNEDTLVVYASSNIYRSEDGGVTFTDVFALGDKAVGIDASIIPECGVCPEGFTLIESFGGRDKRCERTIIGGPLCNPPYFYDTVTNSCAIPSTAIPFNIVLNIDTSGSVNPDERADLVLFLELFVDEMTERLITGNTKIAVVLWNDLSCLQQDFTSDPDTLKSALRAIETPGSIKQSCVDAGYQVSGGTKHAVGFGASVRTLRDQAILRPTAENVIITCTDGTGIGTCDLTDIGYRTVVNDDPCELIRLSDEVKANLAGKPSKMFLLVVGTPNERYFVEQTFINNRAPSCNNTSNYYPSLNDDGQPYFYDGGDFTNVSDFAKQLIIGLEAQISPSFSCPPDCQDVPGSDNLGYCACTDVLEFQDCLYRLVNCIDDQDTIVTDSDLLVYLEANNIITIEGSTNCWQIETTDPGPNPPTTVVVDSVYATCPACTISYAFINCRNTDLIFYSIEDFSNEVGKVVNLVGYSDECWTVALNTNPDYSVEDITIDGVPYNDCPTCISPKYYLSNCNNNTAYLVTKTDLEEYVGQIVSVRGYPGVCFRVDSMYCDCVKVTINTGGRDREYVTYKSLNQINGRNQYIITTGQNADYLLAWNSGELRWEFYDINTNELLSYSPIDSECPYSGYWVNEGSLRVISVQTCVSAISNVEVEKAYTECRCCIYKNCY